jgi:hypothetical protein
MNDEMLQAFLRGALSMGCFVIGLFFLEYRKRTRDRLFVFFALAFWLLSAHWVALTVAAPPFETRHHLFVVRLVAFLSLVVGIVDKNRRSARGDASA